MLNNIFKNHPTILILSGIFIFALCLRFLYFPENIYFGYDQARDAFTILQLLQGHLKIVGPPTGVEGLFHGPLYYYFFAPFYFFSKGDPMWAAAFLRFVNAAAVFIVFLAGRVIFNRGVGLLTAFLFAISFEQTQYALYFNHPSLAVISVTIFYLGLGLLFFRREQKGVLLVSLGLGLSLQFEFVLIYLFPLCGVLLLAYRKYLPKIKKKIFLNSLIILLLPLSSFILAEVKFGFKATKNLTSIISATGGGKGLGQILNNFYLLGTRFINDNLISHTLGTRLALVGLLIIYISFLKNKTLRPRMFFLLIWILGGIIPYINNKSASPLYYYSVGASIGLLVFFGFVINKIWDKSAIAGLFLLTIPVISNLSLITHNNHFGVIPTINVQTGMLLGDEKRVVDYIYNEASGQPFSVSGVTMPLNVNTTWSYLFEWYGQRKYKYLPVWGDNEAAGYPGNLKVISAKSTLPNIRFFIIEPTRGIRLPLIENMLREESYFTKIIKEEKIGDFVIQSRKPF